MTTEQTFIPGFQATVTLDAEDVSAIGNVLSLNLNRNNMSKPVFGSKYARSLGGQRTGTFSASGHISVEKLAALVALFNGDDPISFSIQVGEAAGTTDAGLFEGKCNVTSFGIEANADGEWDWSLDAATDGAVSHTPAA